MQKKAFIILLMSLIMSSCANMGHIKYIMKPEVVSKDEFIDQSYIVTEKYNFKVITVDSLSDKQQELSIQVDELYAEFSSCMNINDKGEGIREFTIAIAKSTFTCNYHYGMCNGEYDPKNNLILVSYKAFKRHGTLPLLQHEWAHAYGILNADHSNLSSVIHCVKY